MLDFGVLSAGGTPVTRKIELHGLLDAQTLSCQASSGDGFTVVGACPMYLRAGETMTFEVTFQPNDLGVHTLPLVVSSMDLELPMRAQVVPGHVTWSTTTVGFEDTQPNPGAAPTIEVALTNTGTAVLGLPVATIEGAGFAIVSAPAITTLLPGMTVTYVIAFTPTAVGRYAATLRLGGLSDVALQGTAVAAAPEPARSENSGCAAGGGNPGGLTLLSILALASVRRRR